MKNWLVSDLVKTFPECDVMIEVPCENGKKCLIPVDQIEYVDTAKIAILKGTSQTI